MEQKSQPRWEYKVSARLTYAPADQIWSLVAKDFFNLHKYYPGIATCYGVHGTNGEPGCVRYCTTFETATGSGAMWFKERLIAANPVDRSLTYEILDCSIGLKSYVASIKVVPGRGGDSGGDGDGGCVIEWSISLDPVEGGRMEDMMKSYEDGLKGKVKKMKDALGSQEQAE
ncbi:hypothetical protein Acr_00g0039870 [Actinidia rufa]|uniref:Polyketide cyclase/dehydrase and lipid transport superfamily protein n=1 Tax=Actinidia rufa TaxID=165716 RepID=A0A7J0DHV2_9ERIC|nr:hypothetical protein Acr_00g0039870 [Actinidia rufa]